ncbi:hypothetical protein THZG08_440009 [Vibrio owensii]|uniref:Uncharacterized protein n=1 Tax=Vibrio owensii TaxID=696485 RepID=A0AAU9Q0J0_9VIBR|nr:hypothetical protein THF1D04_100170 [Vibrio owensii]CAH1533187.1 hypothetical protein THZG08_440009 [Vibrio owensii]CAH1579319.1 hypothetical protein THOA03_440009 [Vibrio owensii]CAH1580494.1 hypothetical protein THOD04_210012 [Vibrio owensii]CAH1589975.1 hypothetical protein THZB04_50371 [Vibrio owensii]
MMVFGVTHLHSHFLTNSPVIILFLSNVNRDFKCFVIKILNFITYNAT